MNKILTKENKHQFKSFRVLRLKGGKTRKIKWAKKDKQKFIKKYTFFEKIKSLDGRKIKLKKPIGSGFSGTAYETNDKNIIAKALHGTSDANQLKGELARGGMIQDALKERLKENDIATLQIANNIGLPFKITKLNNRDVLLSIKVPGVNGFDGIRGSNPTKFINGYKNGYCGNVNVSMNIAQQMATTMRGCNDAKLVILDNWLGNHMIDVSNNGNVKVTIIDFEKSRKNGEKANLETGFNNVSPERATIDYVNGSINKRNNASYRADPKSDVFTLAIELPYIILGRIALKMFSISATRNLPCTFLAKLDKANKKHLKNSFNQLKQLYKKYNMPLPRIEKKQTLPQKIRCLHYDFGFLALQKYLNGKGDAVKYPREVLETMAKLQMYMTEPNPKKRISSRDVEDVLVNLNLTKEEWGNGRFRIDWIDKKTSKAVNKILPKNTTAGKIAGDLGTISEATFNKMCQEMQAIVCK